MAAVAFWANVGTLIALLLNAIALLITARQLWTGRRATSASSLIALNESLRQAWLQFSKAPSETDKQYTFSDIMNLLEIGCAGCEDGLFIGESGTLVEGYLCRTLNLIGGSDDAQARIQKMMPISNTFAHIYRFIRRNRNKISGLQLSARSGS